MTKKTVSYLCGGALAVYAAVLVIATHVPGQRISSWTNVKPTTLGEFLIHFFAYAGLTLLMLAFVTAVRPSFPATRFNVGNSSAGAVLMCVGVFALVDEVTQSLTRRTPQFTDWLADMAGAMVAVFIVLLLYEQVAKLLVRRAGDLPTPCQQKL